LFLYMAKVRMLPVPYKGGGPAMIGLMSGEVHVMLPTIQSVMPFVKAGRMRALAVSTRQRAPTVPDLPTIDEAGVPGYEKVGGLGVFAPAAVRELVFPHIYPATARVLKAPDVVKRLGGGGAIAVENPPAEFDAFVRAEIATWTKLIRE